MSIPCLACAAPCCRHYHVGITIYDAYRLARALSLPLGDFCALEWLEGGGDGYDILLDAPNAGHRLHCLSLRKVREPGPEGALRCVFLLDLGSRGRCGAYHARPEVCRAYPAIERDGIIALTGGGRFCPPGGWQLADQDLPAARSRQRAGRAVRAQHARLAEEWNRHVESSAGPHDATAFFSWLAGTMAGIEAADPQGFERPDAWPPPA